MHVDMGAVPGHFTDQSWRPALQRVIYTVYESSERATSVRLD